MDIESKENYELLTVKVKDFGVIKEGEVKLKPLTIFFGKNNTGKTYMVYLIWGLGNNNAKYLLNINKIDENFKDKILPELKDIMANSNENLENNEIKKKIIEINNLKYKINDNYIKHIFGDTELKINIPYGEISLSNIVIHGQDIIEDLGMWNIATAFIKLLEILFKKQSKNRNGEFETIDLDEDLNFLIENIVLKKLTLESKIRDSLFIPASKSGLVLVNKYLGKEAISSTFGEDNRKSEPLPKPIVEFITSLPAFSDNYSEKVNEKYIDIVEFLQNNILNGKLTYDKTLNNISYQPNNKNMSLPLQYSSSLVVESSPLILYLAYSNYIDEGTLLIVEEPEAHLHPDAQRIFARAITKLINKGIYVLLITHSPYILQQINNNMKLHYLEKTDKEKLNAFLNRHDYKEDEILSPEKVAPYLFVDKGDGAIIKELEIIDDEGISYEAFYHTLLDLHNETEELRDLIEGDDGNFEE